MTHPENPYTGGEQPAQPITPPADPYGLNPNANPNPYTQPQEPAQPYVQNAAPEQGREACGNSNYEHDESAPQFTGNEPAQQPYGTPYEPAATQPTTQINYGAPQNAAPQYGEQPAYGAPTGGAPVYGEPGGPAYGSPAQFPPQGGYDQYPPQGPTDKYNTMAIVGLILAILFPLIGLIVSIIAMVNINKHGGSKASKNLSLAGTIVGGVLTVVSIIVSIIVFNSVLAATNEIVSDSKSPSATHSQTQSTTDPDEDIDEDIDNDIDDIGDQLTDGSITLEEALKNPTVKSELEKQIQGLPDGMKGSVSAEGNTLILTFYVDSSLAAYSDSLAESLNSVGKSAASQLNEDGGNTYSVRIVITSEGKTLYDKTSTND